MLGYSTLATFYKTNFALMQHHKYSLYDIDNMIPWERYVYLDMLREYIKEQEQKAADRAAAQKQR